MRKMGLVFSKNLDRRTFGVVLLRLHCGRCALWWIPPFWVNASVQTDWETKKREELNEKPLCHKSVFEELVRSSRVTLANFRHFLKTHLYILHGLNFKFVFWVTLHLREWTDPHLHPNPNRAFITVRLTLRPCFVRSVFVLHLLLWKKGSVCVFSVPETFSARFLAWREI